MDPFFEQYILKYINPETTQGFIILNIIIVWSIIWKGIALFRSAKLDQKTWFVAILILNTLGILEIAYLFYFAKDKLNPKEVVKSIQSYKFQNPFKKT